MFIYPLAKNTEAFPLSFTFLHCINCLSPEHLNQSALHYTNAIASQFEKKIDLIFNLNWWLIIFYDCPITRVYLWDFVPLWSGNPRSGKTVVNRMSRDECLSTCYCVRGRVGRSWYYHCFSLCQQIGDTYVDRYVDLLGWFLNYLFSKPFIFTYL